MELQAPICYIEVASLSYKKINSTKTAKTHRTLLYIFKISMKLFFRKLKPNHWMDGTENFEITLNEFNPNKK